MAKTKIEVELVVKGDDSVAKVEEKVVSLKQQLKNLKSELASGNLTGKEFDEAAKKAGQLQDRIGDVSQRVKNLASDSQKLDGFISLTQGIVGGFAAVQGITALVGDENEELQKTMVKLQAGMTALAGIQAVANTLNKDSAALTALTTIRTGAQTAATTLLTFATGGATLAMNALRIALLATGIGAIIVLLIAVANKMDLFGQATAKTTEELEKQNEVIDKRNAKNVEADNQDLARIKRKIDLAKAEVKLAGGTQEELLALDRKYLLAKQSFALQELQNDINNEDKRIALEEVNNALRLNNIEKHQARKDALEKRLAEQKKDNKDSPDNEETIQAEADRQFKIDQDNDNKRLDWEQKQISIRLKQDADAAELLQKQRDEQRAIDEESHRRNELAKLQISSDTFSTLTNLGEIFIGQQYKQTAIGKALALTEIAIDTARAISSLTAASEANPANEVTYGLAGVAQFLSGIARISSNILRAKNVLNSGNPSVGGGGSSGGSSASAPPIRGFIPNQDTDTKTGNTKVYVLEKDITDSQGRVARIKSNAELI